MEIQSVATKQALSKGPRDMVQSGANAGHPTMQIIGSQADLSRTPASNEHNANIREGSRHSVASSVPLNTAAHHGYESASTPMSDRTMVKK